MLLPSVELITNHTPQIYFCRAALQTHVPQSTCSTGLHQPRCRFRHLSLLNFLQLVILSAPVYHNLSVRTLYPQRNEWVPIFQYCQQIYTVCIQILCQVIDKNIEEDWA